MPDREKVIRAVGSCFDYWLEQHRCLHPLELEDVRQFKADALAMLKEQEEQKQKWLQNIADNQLANAPKHDRNDFMSLDEHMEYQYQLGVYDGLQMAWDILTEGDETGCRTKMHP